ncbi:MAG: CoA transferase [Rubrivivax sp.]
MDTSPATAPDTLRSLWALAALPKPALAHALLPWRGPVLASSFNVAVAAQASLAAGALAAAEIWHRRSGQPRQQVTVDGEHAVFDSLAYLRVNGQAPQVWDKISGLYACAEGHVRIHANFAHHRDGALRLLGLPAGEATERAAVAAALASWRALDFEAAAAEAGLVVAAVRRFDEWDAHPQAKALAGKPPVALRRIGDAPPRAWPALGTGARPLAGLRVLDLTRILAGPVAGRTLAAWGADVMLVNSPALPNIDAIADTSRGKLSAHVELKSAEGRATLLALAREGHVFLQGYRPGALAALGFGAEALAEAVPGIVHVSLSAYGSEGPWAGRRGFDSLVQTATGFNHAEAQAFGQAEPRALPLQILDYAAGYLLAFGAQAALLRQAAEGGSWAVEVTLAGVGHWLRTLGRRGDAFAIGRPQVEPYTEEEDSGFGRLRVVRHAVQFSRTPAGFSRPSVPPGTDPPRWPQR